MLIALEGLDGCGKTTVGDFVASGLKGKLLHFPDDEAVTGPMIRGYLRGKWAMVAAPSSPSSWEAMAFQALQFVNRLERWRDLEGASRSTRSHLVLSRYWPSGVVYGGMDGIDPHWLQGLGLVFPTPDLLILLDVPPEVAAARRRARDNLEPERYEAKLETYRDARDRFHDLWDAYKSCPEWVTVDASLPLNEVVSEVWSKVTQALLWEMNDV